MVDPWNGDSNWPVLELPLKLVPHLVHVIRVPLDRSKKSSIELMDCLSAEERARADRYRFEEPRCRFVTCRSALRQLLGNACGVSPQAVPLIYGAHGKPELAVPDTGTGLPKIEFSVSHSGDLGLIAMAVDSPVGVDIEQLDPAVRTLKLAERFFAAAEAEDLRNLVSEKQLAGFYRGWTSKEAYIKAKGRGLSLSLRSFRVAMDPDQPASLLHVDGLPDEPLSWTTCSIDVSPNYAAVVMVAQPECQIQKWDWQLN